jgi:hypothetical protein
MKILLLYNAEQTTTICYINTQSGRQTFLSVIVALRKQAVMGLSLKQGMGNREIGESGNPGILESRNPGIQN